MNDDSNETDLHTPLIPVPDPAIRRELERLWAANERVRKSVHQLRNELAVRKTEDEASIERVEDQLRRGEKDMAKLESLVEKAVAASSSWWKWIVGQVVAGALIVGGAWMTVRERIATAEAQIDHQNRSLDRVEDKLDAIGDELRARPSGPSSGQLGGP